MIHAPVATIEQLLSPLQVGPRQLKNRICMPAMHLNFTMGGEVSEQLVRFYAERARGGVAMITVGGCGIDRPGGGLHLIGLHDDRFVPGLARLAGAIHAGGALALAQLYHAGKYAMSKLTGTRPVSASAIRSKLTGETPRELSVDEIDEVQRAFAAAAARALEAGFDGVEVLASAGYLISQFLSPVSNRRDDDYGGDFDGRVRFGREVVERVRAAAGDERLVTVRVAGADYVPGGLASEDSARVARVFERAGADAINVTGGWHETRVPQLTMGVPRGAFLYLARAIRDAVAVPVMASNRCNDPYLAEAAVRDRLADLINMGRPLIADPELPNKVAAGQADQVVRCVACNQGCFDNVFAARPVTCTVNPRAGREAELPPPQPAPEAREVLVVGAGPAGLMAAVTAARRGHRVTVLERGGRPGGQLLLAAACPGRRELATVVDDLGRQAEQLGVAVELGHEATPQTIAQRGPDVVILATGARPATPDLEGVELPHVVQAWDVLAGRAAVGPRVAVVGGGPVAVDVAIDLSQRGTLDGETLRFLLLTGAEPAEELRQRCLRGTHRVTVIEVDDKIGRAVGRSTRWTLIQQLKRHGVELLDQTPARRIDEQGVWVELEHEDRLIPADTVVLATGAEPSAWLAEALQEERGIEVVTVGDAREPRRAFEAIHDGFHAGMSV